jgi:hypothetical protein
VAELILIEDAVGRPTPLDSKQLWVGDDPLELGTRRSELAALGVPDAAAHQQRADIAILRAATAQDAGITFVPDGSLDLVDGIGALLRWTDPATPHEASPSYTHDRQRLSKHPR